MSGLGLGLNLTKCRVHQYIIYIYQHISRFIVTIEKKNKKIGKRSKQKHGADNGCGWTNLGLGAPRGASAPPFSPGGAAAAEWRTSPRH